MIALYKVGRQGLVLGSASPSSGSWSLGWSGARGGRSATLLTGPEWGGRPICVTWAVLCPEAPAGRLQMLGRLDLRP